MKTKQTITATLYLHVTEIDVVILPINACSILIVLFLYARMFLSQIGIWTAY